MKLLRITGLIIFLLSATAFISYKIYQINVVDTSKPVIDCSNSIAASTKVTEKELTKDVKANDMADGDVTDSVIIEKISALSGKNKRTITYAAYDSSGNVAEKERELVYTDYTSPRFSLSQPLDFPVSDQVDLVKNMKVTDCIDGDLTEKIKYELPSQFFENSEGSFKVKFMVTNSAGETAYLPATVELHYPYSNSDKVPVINLIQYIVYVKVGESFDAGEYLNSVSIGNKDYLLQDSLSKDNKNKDISKSNISVKSNVDMKVPGVYEVRYSMKTEEGFTGTTRLIVVVEE